MRLFIENSVSLCLHYSINAFFRIRLSFPFFLHFYTDLCRTIILRSTRNFTFLSYPFSLHRAKSTISYRGLFESKKIFEMKRCGTRFRKMPYRAENGAKKFFRFAIWDRYFEKNCGRYLFLYVVNWTDVRCPPPSYKTNKEVIYYDKTTTTHHAPYLREEALC